MRFERLRSKLDREREREKKKTYFGHSFESRSNANCEWMRVASDEQIASTWFATLKHVIRQSAELTSGYRERSGEGRRDDCEWKKRKRKQETEQRKHTYWQWIRWLTHFLKILWSRNALLLKGWLLSKWLWGYNVWNVLMMRRESSIDRSTRLPETKSICSINRLSIERNFFSFFPPSTFREAVSIVSPNSRRGDE